MGYALTLVAVLSAAIHIRAEHLGPRLHVYIFKPLTTLIICAIAALGQASPPLYKAMIIGELSLDGSVRHVKGVLPMAAKARDAGLTTLYVPRPTRRKRP